MVNTRELVFANGPSIRLLAESWYVVTERAKVVRLYSSWRSLVTLLTNMGMFEGVSKLYSFVFGLLRMRTSQTEPQSAQILFNANL